MIRNPILLTLVFPAHSLLQLPTPGFRELIAQRSTSALDVVPSALRALLCGCLTWWMVVLPSHPYVPHSLETTFHISVSECLFSKALAHIWPAVSEQLKWTWKPTHWNRASFLYYQLIPADLYEQEIQETENLLRSTIKTWAKNLSDVLQPNGCGYISTATDLGIVEDKEGSS